MTELRFRSMGCDVVAVGDDLGEVEELFRAADARFTRFREDSELARVNGSTGPVLVSAEFARALHAAVRAHRETGGLVDPTLLDELEAAGYDRDFESLDPRGACARRPARAAPALPIQLHGRLLVRAHGARIDLNGVVKSLAVDDALDRIGHGWVSAGGDLATSRPLEVALPGGGQIRLERGALATSGRTTRSWMQDGVERHHLIDPRSGRPSDSPWREVTVCGSTCVDADVAAKAAFLLGADGPGWLDERGLAGWFLARDGSTTPNRTWAACI